MLSLSRTMMVFLVEFVIVWQYHLYEVDAVLVRQNASHLARGSMQVMCKVMAILKATV